MLTLPTWSLEFLAAIRLTEEGAVWSFLKKGALLIIQEEIGQQNIIKCKLCSESHNNSCNIMLIDVQRLHADKFVSAFVNS